MKNKISILLFILSFCHIAKAQNLVSNGYFEVLDSCPHVMLSDVEYISDAIGWFPASATPDVFNSCATDSYGVPDNGLGYQKAFYGGNGYAGEYVFYINGAGNDNREYIYTKLMDTLKVGHIYIASMYVNSSNYWHNAITTMGMLFTDTTTLLPIANSYIIQAIPQVKSNILLADTTNWMLVQDTFRTISNEIYLTIGNFDNRNTCGVVNSNSESYYYIDGVSVYDITGGTCNNYWDAGYDKYIPAGDSIRLGAINTDNSTYTWQNSTGGATYLSSNTDARPWSKPAQTTTYYVTKTCPNNTVFKDTVTVYVQQITGIKQILGNSRINLYPNPSNGNMDVDYNVQENAQLDITDINGNLVGTYNMPLVKTQLQIKNSELPSGIYFYRVMCKDTVVKLGKIVIIK